MIDQQASRVPYEWAIELMSTDELVEECEGLIGLRRLMVLHATTLEQLAHAFHEHERGSTLRRKKSILPSDIENLEDSLRLSWWPVIVGHEFEPAHLEELHHHLSASLLELNLLRNNPIGHEEARAALGRKMTSVGQQAKFIADA